MYLLIYCLFVDLLYILGHSTIFLHKLGFIRPLFLLKTACEKFKPWIFPRIPLKIQDLLPPIFKSWTRAFNNISWVEQRKLQIHWDYTLNTNPSEIRESIKKKTHNFHPFQLLSTRITLSYLSTIFQVIILVPKKMLVQFIYI